MIDSDDRERIEDCRYELMQVMSAEELKKCCLLVLANKQDLPNAMTISEISEKLELNKLPEDRHWC